MQCLRILQINMPRCTIVQTKCIQLDEVYIIDEVFITVRTIEYNYRTDIYDVYHTISRFHGNDIKCNLSPTLCSV